MYTILYWTFHVHGFVHDFMRVLWYCVILHDVTFALKALYFNGIDIVWHAMIKKLLVPLSPLNTKISRKSHKSNICETFLLPFDLSYIFLQVEIIRI